MTDREERGGRRPRGLCQRPARPMWERDEREGREARNFEPSPPQTPVERPLSVSRKSPRDSHEPVAERCDAAGEHRGPNDQADLPLNSLHAAGRSRY